MNDVDLKVNESSNFPNMDEDSMKNIDDDELLFFPNGLIAFYEELIENNDYANYKINNIEACYTNKTNNIFKTPYFCCNSYQFTSYTNGKSIGNLSKHITSFGPHLFTGNNYNLNSCGSSINWSSSLIQNQNENMNELNSNSNNQNVSEQYQNLNYNNSSSSSKDPNC